MNNSIINVTRHFHAGQKRLFSLSWNKKVFVLRGVIALILALSVFSSCGNPTSLGNGTPPGSSKLTISGLPLNGTYSVYVFASNTDISTYMDMAKEINSQNWIALGESPSGDTFALTDKSGSAWNGQGSMPVVLINPDGSLTDYQDPRLRWATVGFSSGTGSVSMSNFTAVVQGGGNTDPENPSAGVLTITGLISGGDYLVYVFEKGTDVSTYDAFMSAGSNGDCAAQTVSRLGNAFALVNYGSSDSPWNGQGSYPVVLYNKNGGVTDLINPMYRWANVYFEDGNGSISINSLTAAVQEEPIQGIKITGLLPDGVYSVYVFVDADISTYSGITSAISSSSWFALGINPSEGIFALNDKGFSPWTDSGDYGIVLVNDKGSPNDPQNPEYRNGAASFSNGKTYETYSVDNLSAVLQDSSKAK